MDSEMEDFDGEGDQLMWHIGKIGMRTSMEKGWGSGGVLHDVSFP